MVDFSGGVSIPLGSAVMIKPLVSLSYMRFSWIAQNGYTEYESDGWKRKSIQGTGLSYDQSWLILSPGIGLTWPVLRALSLDMNLFISPLIVCSDVDIHKLTKKEYHDYMRGGFYWEPALDCIFSPTPNLSLTFHGSWRSITGLRGDTMQLPIGSSSGTSFIGQAGAAYSAFDLGISLKLRL
jgi:outer membrane protease